MSAGEGPPDGELLRRVAEGDREAQEILYRRYGPGIQRHISYLRRSRPWLNEGDALHETFRRARESAHTFEQGRPALPWLRAILENWSMQVEKRQRREVPLETGPEFEPADTNAPDPLDLLETKQQILELYRALARLNVQDRSLLNAVVFEGRSPSQVAANLGITPNTLRVRLLRAKRRLAALSRKE